MRLVLLLLAAVTCLGLGAVPPAAHADSWTPSREGVWPLQPRPAVVEGFDPPAVRWGAGHRGVDLAGWPGAPVRASLGGTISFAAPIAGRGVVVVDHGPVRTTYQPVRTSLRVGDRVTKGQVVGTLVRAGSHCFPGSCLHWGLRRGETYLDPLLLVGGGPVRLLPLTQARGWANRYADRSRSLLTWV
jgi:murein DD-endopeptidase MepM/ murein hydrolase activator NlpD